MTERFETQDQLLETINIGDNQCFYSQQTKKNSGQKMHSSIDIDDFWKIEILLGVDKHVYEWIPDNLNTSTVRWKGLNSQMKKVLSEYNYSSNSYVER